MCNTGLGVCGQVRLELLPIVLVVANALAPGAHWNKALQLLDPAECFFELTDAFSQRRLQLDDAAADSQPRPQLLGIERLRDIIVRPTLQACDKAFCRAQSRQQD